MPRLVVLSLGIAVILSGCGFVEMLTGGGVPPVVAELEVFNRTVEDLEYEAADGEILEVPACGTAVDSTFRIDTVRVRAAGGYVRGFGGGDPALAGKHVVVVEVSSAADSGIPEPAPAPDPLPPCEGRPEAQPGT